MITRLLRHGAEHVDRHEFSDRSVIVWQIGPDQEISDTCVHLEEFMASAARNSSEALEVIASLHSVGEMSPTC